MFHVKRTLYFKPYSYKGHVLYTQFPHSYPLKDIQTIGTELVSCAV